MENSQLLEENMRMMRPSTFPVSMRSHLTVLWRFLCVHASVCRENEKKREEKTDGGREREREREREKERVPVREDAEERYGGNE